MYIFSIVFTVAPPTDIATLLHGLDELVLYDHNTNTIHSPCYPSESPVLHANDIVRLKDSLI